MALPEFEESGHGGGGREQRCTQQGPEGPLAKATAQAGSQLGLWLLLSPVQLWKAQLIQKSHFNQLDEV